MTDARLKSEWLNTMRFDNLTDATWRVFSSALMWSAENGTNGLVPDRYLKMLHPDGVMPDAIKQMVEAELWTKAEGGYQFLDWDGALGQSTAEQVETYKANARKRARDYRERERSKLAKTIGFVDNSAPSITSDVTRDVTGEVRGHVGKGKGEGAGNHGGSENDNSEVVNYTTGEVSDTSEPRRETVRDGNKVRRVPVAS